MNDWPGGNRPQNAYAIRGTRSEVFNPLGQAGVCSCCTGYEYKHASQDTSANPTKDSPTCPERDGRETTHDDGSTVNDNNPPNHRIPTHGVGRFLWECDPRTPVSELGELYTRWKDESQQANIGEWSE